MEYTVIVIVNWAVGFESWQEQEIYLYCKKPTNAEGSCGFLLTLSLLN
jgi:hypothetical protein